MLPHTQVLINTLTSYSFHSESWTSSFKSISPWDWNPGSQVGREFSSTGFLDSICNMLGLFLVCFLNVLELSHYKALPFEIWSRIWIGVDEGTKMHISSCRGMSEDNEGWWQSEYLSRQTKIKALSSRNSSNSFRRRKKQSYWTFEFFSIPNPVTDN